VDANRDPFGHLVRLLTTQVAGGDDFVATTQLIAILHHWRSILSVCEPRLRGMIPEN